MRKIKFMKFIHVITLIIVIAIATITALFVIDDQAFVSAIASVLSNMGAEVDIADLISKLSLILPICLLFGIILLIIEEFFYSRIVKKVKRDEAKRRFKLSRKNKRLFSKEAPTSQVAESVTINIVKSNDDIKEKRKETKRELKDLKKKAKLEKRIAKEEARKAKLAELEAEVAKLEETEVEDIAINGQDIVINTTQNKTTQNKTETKSNSSSQNDLDDFLRNITK